MHIRLVLAVLLIAGSYVPSRAARAAESYDNCAGTIASLPATITTQGVWCLKSDLATNISTNSAAIRIDTNNVTIDCNGFKIGGLAGGLTSQAAGIFALNRQNITVRHCNIRGFLRGISLSGAGHLVEDNRLDGNLASGIEVYGDNNRIRRNAVFDTGGGKANTPGGTVGYTAAEAIKAEADITDNIVDGVFTDGTTLLVSGIHAYGAGTQVRDNRIGGLALNGGGAAYGIYPAGTDQVFSGNSIVAKAAGTSGYGIYANGTNSFCTGNTVAYFTVAIYSCQKDGNGEH